MAGNRTAAAKVRSLSHQGAALALRCAGLSFAAIGTRIGVCKAQAFKLVRKGLEETRLQIAGSADTLRSEELARLDGMLQKVYPRAARGDLAAVDRVLKIGERRARLLGLDAPTRTALEGTEGAPPISTEAKVTFYMPSNGRG